ncbi:hypothetical protein [Nocardioides sp. YIM 152315]|uniref:hypothetical protein n=1 Tax=Nocardioides sp. YIM 152315 TaxID=3031760 RepID=UPI0023DA4266|nr:hypothetical protein [Nocardioides sp. YIM 152315]MDF1605700.1 hypothetical protein [Nocardioides sp. YIM 152315]
MTGVRRRVLELSLLAYPRGQRSRDRELLLDLALDLSADHGTVRESAGLVRAGLAARWARPRSVRRRVAAACLGLAAVSAGLAVVAPQSVVTAETEVHQPGGAR